MTDLKNFVLMLTNSNEAFTKLKCGNNWVVTIVKKDSDIEFSFNSDESFKHCFININK
jgi:hypothetical protein